MHFVSHKQLTKTKMAKSIQFSCLFSTVSVFFVLLSLANSQTPSIQQCSTSLLLPLAPCAPFVQAGTVTLPSQQCCNGLIELYSQRPRCFCFLLNNTNLPINNTLALQLPSLCNLHVDPSSCSVVGLALPPASPHAARVPFWATINSTRAEPPVVRVIPRSGIVGVGFGSSDAAELEIEGSLVAAAVIVLLAFVGF